MRVSQRHNGRVRIPMVMAAQTLTLRSLTSSVKWSSRRFTTGLGRYPTGTTCTNIRMVAKSQTLLINEQSRLMESTGQKVSKAILSSTSRLQNYSNWFSYTSHIHHKVYKLGFGQSPFPPPPHLIDALRNNAHVHGYLPVQGLQASPL